MLEGNRGHEVLGARWTDPPSRGFRIALISNAIWRDGATYLQDFAELGTPDVILAAFSSVEIGFRNPTTQCSRPPPQCSTADPPRSSSSATRSATTSLRAEHSAEGGTEGSVMTYGGTEGSVMTY